MTERAVEAPLPLLLVDDEADLVALWRTACEQVPNARLTVANSLARAHELLPSQPWQWVVVDSQLPADQGLSAVAAFCKQLRDRPSPPQTVLMVNSFDELLPALEAADRALLRPFTVARAVAALTQAS